MGTNEEGEREVKTKWPGVIDLLGDSLSSTVTQIGARWLPKAGKFLSEGEGRWTISECTERDGAGENTLLYHRTVTRRLYVMW